MKINHGIEKSDIELRGNVDSNVMKIKDSSKLFAIMIDGLYQDKLGAVIRELASNAIDAHKIAKKENVQFIIGVPTDTSKNFYFQDFGDGLSHEDIVKYFGTLLESKKDGDDDQIGGYGIGCKSPFAIVDEFIVSSVQNGIETTVLFVRENKGTPEFHTISINKTNKPNGTRVSMEYEENEGVILDSIKYRLAAIETKPKIFIGNKETIINYPIRTYFGPNFSTVIASDLSAKYYNSYLDIGGILYPIDDFVDPLYNPPNKSFSYIYKAKISDIKPAPDRERIEITENNKKIINEIQLRQYEDYVSHIKKDFLSIEQYNNKSVNEFIKKYNGIIGNINNLVSSMLPYPKESMYIKEYCRNIYSNDSFYKLLSRYIGEKTYFKASGLYEVNKKNIFCKSQSIYRFNAMFDCDYMVITSNAILYDIKKLLGNKINKRIAIIRVKKAQLDFMIEVIKELSLYYSLPKENILTIETNKSVVRQKSTNNANGIIKYVEDSDGSMRSQILTEDEYDSLSNEEFVLFDTCRYGYRSPYFDFSIIKQLSKGRKVIVAKGRKYNKLYELSTCIQPCDALKQSFDDPNVVNYFLHSSKDLKTITENYYYAKTFKNKAFNHVDVLVDIKMKKIGNEPLTMKQLYNGIGYNTPKLFSNTFENININSSDFNDIIKNIITDHINTI